MTSLTSRIVGGKMTRPGEWPWMAALFIEEGGIKTAQCGGALITHDAVLTASHCLVESSSRTPASRLTVRLGEYNIEKETPDDAAQDFAVESVITHSEYNSKTYLNDIAILKLKRSVSFSKRISPICLPFENRKLKEENIEGRSATITGWGRITYNGPSSEVLLKAEINIVNQEQCRKALERWIRITEKYLCAGSKGSKRDSCQGDSGGPLVMYESGRWYLMGIVSFGLRCATPGSHIISHFKIKCVLTFFDLTWAENCSFPKQDCRIENLLRDSFEVGYVDLGRGFERVLILDTAKMKGNAVQMITPYLRSAGNDDICITLQYFANGDGVQQFSLSQQDKNGKNRVVYQLSEKRKGNWILDKMSISLREGMFRYLLEAKITNGKEGTLIIRRFYYKNGICDVAKVRSVANRRKQRRKQANQQNS
ncbi:prophenoloxidase activating enzyme-like protein [Dinothrombium tinctorium]|uniref:Prophenoloxidase activating enzyme-like protein n=1 Tax=Dinothrombium tinctorium TaxID=1965070 RepID=A0A3S3QGK5_9ACAR|nr:prophenoloxidase activating enzyme-like protein [Dinothrombium tinctorium]RWS08534.1 prophenoloxidase activating enzyme-like protein [Dinothrombium tinctorium]